MTQPYVGSPGDGSQPTALDLGHALARIARAGFTDDRRAEVQAIVRAMAATPGETPADALPLTNLAATLMTAIADRMPAAEDDASQDLRELMIIAAALAKRASMTLEAATGIPAASFDGDVRLAN